MAKVGPLCGAQQQSAHDDDDDSGVRRQRRRVLISRRVCANRVNAKSKQAALECVCANQLDGVVWLLPLLHERVYHSQSFCRVRRSSQCVVCLICANHDFCAAQLTCGELARAREEKQFYGNQIVTLNLGSRGSPQIYNSARSREHLTTCGCRKSCTDDCNHFGEFIRPQECVCAIVRLAEQQQQLPPPPPLPGTNVIIGLARLDQCSGERSKLRRKWTASIIFALQVCTHSRTSIRQQSTMACVRLLLESILPPIEKEKYNFAREREWQRWQQ